MIDRRQLGLGDVERLPARGCTHPQTRQVDEPIVREMLRALGVVTCERCHEALHSCLNCTFHDTSAYNECRETSAERVVDKKAGNFCDFFQPAATSPGAAASPQGSALSELDRLFKKQ